MDVNKDSHQFHRLEVVETGRRRRWNLAEKQRIVAESYSGPRQVATTARRYGISRGLLYAWRRELRACQGQLPTAQMAEAASETPRSVATGGRGQIEIALPSGIRLYVESGIDPEALRRVLGALR
jgi:transposase